jgi:Putative Actinobacterial Holin-X, holin superfamily III
VNPTFESTTDHDPATQPKRPELSLGELVGELTTELSTLFRKEIERAKTEAREEASHAGKAAGMFGGAAVAGWLALLMLSLTLAWLLDDEAELDRAVSFVIVGALWVVVAIILQAVGRSRLAKVRGLPTTKATIKEDVEWAKAQNS